MESLARLLLTHRRLVVAALLALATWAGIEAVRHTPDTVAVPVAARDLAGGSTVADADVVTRHLPAHVVPDGVLTSTFVDRSLAGPMRAGEVFTDARVVDPRDLPGGRVMAMIEVPPAAGELVRVGDLVDVLSVTEESSAETIAESVPVVTAHADPDRAAAVLGVAAAPSTASRLARAAVATRLTVVVATAHPARRGSSVDP